MIRPPLPEGGQSSPLSSFETHMQCLQAMSIQVKQPTEALFSNPGPSQLGCLTHPTHNQAHPNCSRDALPQDNPSWAGWVGVRHVDLGPPHIMSCADNVLVQIDEGQCPGSCLAQFTNADIQDGEGQFGLP